MVYVNHMTNEQWVVAVANDWLGLVVSPAQATEILADPKVIAELAAGGQDTCSREVVCDCLSLRIIGRPVPRNGDGEAAATAFWADLDAKSEAAGYPGAAFRALLPKNA